MEEFHKYQKPKKTKSSKSASAAYSQKAYYIECKRKFSELKCNLFKIPEFYLGKSLSDMAEEEQTFKFNI